MDKQLKTSNTSTEGSMARRIVVVLAGLIEIVLGFRFVFKLLGANPSNVFVKGIYDITQVFVGVFEGIFSKAVTAGAETKAIFEPGTVIAMIVIALIAWGVMKLMSQRSSSSEVKKTEYTEDKTDETKGPDQN